VRRTLRILVVAAAILGTAGPALAAFGALAYSPATGNYGYSYGYSTRAGAESRALGGCKVGSCRVVAWYQNACGALAKGSTGWGAAWAASRAKAEASAIRTCRGQSAKCRIIAWSCSG
jgi:hypothetical protein